MKWEGEGFKAFCFDSLSQDTHTSGWAVLSLAAAAASGAPAELSALSGPAAWPAMVLLNRRMLICSSSLSTTGVARYCLVKP